VVVELLPPELQENSTSIATAADDRTLNCFI
jgi:hypothetical protein